MSGGVGIPRRRIRSRTISLQSARASARFMRKFWFRLAWAIARFIQMGRSMLAPRSNSTYNDNGDRRLMDSTVNLMRPAMACEHLYHHHHLVMGKEQANYDHKIQCNRFLCENNDVKFTVRPDVPKNRYGGDIMIIMIKRMVVFRWVTTTNRKAALRLNCS